MTRGDAGWTIGLIIGVVVIAQASAQCTSGVCANGVCKWGYTGYVCECDVGYQNLYGNQSVCVDYDECRVHTVCPDGWCINYDGSYECKCNYGFKQTPDRKGCTYDTNVPFTNTHGFRDFLSSIGYKNPDMYLAPPPVILQQHTQAPDIHAPQNHAYPQPYDVHQNSNQYIPPPNTVQYQQPNPIQYEPQQYPNQYNPGTFPNHRNAQASTTTPMPVDVEPTEASPVPPETHIPTQNTQSSLENQRIDQNLQMMWEDPYGPQRPVFLDQTPVELNTPKSQPPPSNQIYHPSAPTPESYGLPPFPSHVPSYGNQAVDFQPSQNQGSWVDALGPQRPAFLDQPITRPTHQVNDPSGQFHQQVPQMRVEQGLVPNDAMGYPVSAPHQHHVLWNSNPQQQFPVRNGPVPFTDTPSNPTPSAQQMSSMSLSPEYNQPPNNLPLPYSYTYPPVDFNNASPLRDLKIDLQSVPMASSEVPIISQHVNQYPFADANMYPNPYQYPENKYGPGYNEWQQPYPSYPSFDPYKQGQYIDAVPDTSNSLQADSQALPNAGIASPETSRAGETPATTTFSPTSETITTTAVTDVPTVFPKTTEAAVDRYTPSTTTLVPDSTTTTTSTPDTTTTTVVTTPTTTTSAPSTTTPRTTSTTTPRTTSTTTPRTTSTTTPRTTSTTTPRTTSTVSTSTTTTATTTPVEPGPSTWVKQTGQNLKISLGVDLSGTPSQGAPAPAASPSASFKIQADGVPNDIASVTNAPSAEATTVTSTAKVTTVRSVSPPTSNNTPAYTRTTRQPIVVPVVPVSNDRFNITNSQVNNIQVRPQSPNIIPKQYIIKIPPKDRPSQQPSPNYLPSQQPSPNYLPSQQPRPNYLPSQLPRPHSPPRQQPIPNYLQSQQTSKTSPPSQQPRPRSPPRQQPIPNYLQSQQPSKTSPPRQQPRPHSPPRQQPIPNYLQSQETSKTSPPSQQPRPHFPPRQQPIPNYLQSQQPSKTSPPRQQPRPHSPPRQQPIPNYLQSQQPSQTSPPSQQPRRNSPPRQQPRPTYPARRPSAYDTKSTQRAPQTLVIRQVKNPPNVQYPVRTQNQPRRKSIPLQLYPTPKQYPFTTRKQYVLNVQNRPGQLTRQYPPIKHSTISRPPSHAPLQQMRQRTLNVPEKQPQYQTKQHSTIARLPVHQNWQHPPILPQSQANYPYAAHASPQFSSRLGTLTNTVDRQMYNVRPSGSSVQPPQRLFLTRPTTSTHSSWINAGTSEQGNSYDAFSNNDVMMTLLISQMLN